MRYRWLGEHSGSIDGRNCYPIETKGKGRRRMDVTSSGTGSPIIGFMIGVPLHLRSLARKYIIQAFRSRVSDIYQHKHVRVHFFTLYGYL